MESEIERLTEMWGRARSWTAYTDADFANDSDAQEAAETAVEQLGHRVVSIFDPQRGVLKLFLDPPEWMSPASLELADDEYRGMRKAK